MNKSELLNEIENYQQTNYRNRMGCSEDWYDFAFAMKCTFTKEEIQNMTDRELEYLEKLANNIQEALY